MKVQKYGYKRKHLVIKIDTILSLIFILIFLLKIYREIYQNITP